MTTSLVAFLSVLSLVQGARVSVQDRIVGGYKIDISLVQWQVSVQVNGRHVCGGSIISSQWVLSAAHCTFPYRTSKFKIRIGSTSSNHGGKLYYVKEIVNHEDYDNAILKHDICVLKTASEMNLDLPVKAVTLPDAGAERPPVGTPLLMSGWGMMADRSVPTLLRAVDVVIRGFKECNFGVRDESTQLCAGAPGKGSCFGDSGGPLVKDELLVGIASCMAANEPCAKRPLIYTDVTVYRDWIKTHTGV